jgi:DNA repair exonuclease SbcCD nuclease subunit
VTTNQKSSPIAILISDIHFSVNNLQLASLSLEKALVKAKALNLPLIIAGDLNDTKAIVRGEVMNALIDILSHYDNTYITIGNHDLLNEKGEAHSLNFLRPYAKIIDKAEYIEDLGLWLLPYYSDPNRLTKVLGYIPEGSTIIMHQGVCGADMGAYVQDKASLLKDTFANYRVISGHYHRAQDIKCGRPRKGAVGLFSYIGSPYTTSFSEAGDGPKGYRILMSDGTLESVPTNLRKHIVVDREVTNALAPIPEYNPGDLVWFKLRGPTFALNDSKKSYIGNKLFGHENFKLDKIPMDLGPSTQYTRQFTEEELLDSIIDRTGESESQKKTLKALWREILSEI